MTEINPYNFVPLKNGPLRKAAHSGRFRTSEKSEIRYSGEIECELTAFSPLVTLGKSDEYKTDDKRKVYKFLRNSNGEPIIQGSSLKGMIRSVYEAMTDSCMTLAATDGLVKKTPRETVPYNYQDLGEYENGACGALDALCPACRLFGTVNSEISFQGRVFLNDAVMHAGSNLVTQLWYLKELSGPKPYHSGIYGRDGGQIAGRKFYYHQGQSPNFTVEEKDWSTRAIAIKEHAPVGCTFSFRVFIENLEKDELRDLILAIELDGAGESLGHKIGLGKSVGLGSCRITIKRNENSRITDAKGRFESFSPSAANNWPDLSPDTSKLDNLKEVLRLNKPDDGGVIEYPGYGFYMNNRNVSINQNGYFTAPGIPRRAPQVVAAELRDYSSVTPDGPPPEVGSDQKAVYLADILNDNELIFLDSDSKPHRRAINHYQGNKKLLEIGRWFIFSGEKRVIPKK